MRKFQGGLLVAALAVLWPALAFAGNQETAEQIARQLQQSGQLHHYRIQVKYQDGTAWLQGQVSDQQQMAAALRMALSAPGVDRVVNQLSVQSAAQTAGAYPQPVTANRVAYQQPAAYPVVPATAPEPSQQSSGSPISAAARRLQGMLSAAVGVKKPSPQTQSYAQPNTMVYPVAAYQQMPEAPGQLAPMPGAAPMPIAYRQGETVVPAGPMPGGPRPMYTAGMGGQTAPVRYDQPHLPNYSWPSYAAYPNYAALTYPKQYSATAWPYIGPFYPYPQVPLGWRRVTLEWDDGWWFLDFKDTPRWGDTPISSWR